MPLTIRILTCPQTNVALPFWSISKCSQRMSPTKSGAKSRKRSFPIAHRVAPFMQNLSKSTFFRLNSFTVHVSHSATWFSVHCLGSEEDHNWRLLYSPFTSTCIHIQHSSPPESNFNFSGPSTMNCSAFYIMLTVRKTQIFGMPPTITPALW